MDYHCPWCGGIASDSHRASLFHELDRDACTEIIEKTKSCVTIEDVIQLFGQPDDDELTAIKHNEKLDQSPRVDRVRQVTFHELHDDLSVSFVQQIDGTLSQAFTPKPIQEGRQPNYVPELWAGRNPNATSLATTC